MNKARREERRAQKEAARRRNPDPLWWMEAESLNDDLQRDATDDMVVRIMEKIEHHIKEGGDWEVLEEVGGVIINGLESYRQQWEQIKRRLNPPQM